MDTQTEVDVTGAQVFISVTDACIAAEKSERTMRRWLSSGKVKSYPGPGGQVRIDRAELLLALAKTRPKAAQAASAARATPATRHDTAPGELVTELRDQITDLKAQREDWKAQCKSLQAELRAVRQELTEAREARRAVERELRRQPAGLLSRAAKRFGL